MSAQRAWAEGMDETARLFRKLLVSQHVPRSSVREWFQVHVSDYYVIRHIHVICQPRLFHKLLVQPCVPRSSVRKWFILLYFFFQATVLSGRERTTEAARMQLLDSAVMPDSVALNVLDLCLRITAPGIYVCVCVCNSRHTHTHTHTHTRNRVWRYSTRARGCGG
jgi:hypothetical protein